VLQGKKFDPEGTYVKQWVPEVAGLPPKWIHAPWVAPPAVLKKGGVTLGQTYPKPIVDHAEARARAFEAFASIRRS
jgi:deoxyribodipyrimidine photo-lyase